ncbi:hypothetical protein N5J43_13545 [Pseudomonas nicosulfuronedens]|uniref:hypothetical protein n=1 Tax=Pseudomonas nicosulfuronedens TaxID=2571105 RepID=UPI0024470B55|nr:hypothetical protein [Pseudomonas nicosulfuronedens]MDH1012471.1 hypothetical protein [Pseudomonas nicosulfuronedens]MDH1979976.1 hypothetical protein [Pseudomonas nicosulfuronedens]MDH2029914.1 hypothetical protein [Pseudomonas nicosulfuronedens]
MSEIDNVTRERIREWQIRRLEIKDQMYLHPEKTLALSKVLDLMDSEHADILSGSKSSQTVSGQQGATLELTAPAVYSPSPALGRFDLQLHISARDSGDLRRLLEMAVYELQEKINTNGTVVMNEHRKYPGGMSGTLGNYQFELGIIGESSHE